MDSFFRTTDQDFSAVIEHLILVVLFHLFPAVTIPSLSLQINPWDHNLWKALARAYALARNLPF